MERIEGHYLLSFHPPLNFKVPVTVVCLQTRVRVLCLIKRLPVLRVCYVIFALAMTTKCTPLAEIAGVVWRGHEVGSDFQATTGVWILRQSLS